MSLAGTVRGWRRWLDGWFEQRSPRSDSLQLSHRNVYIVPTRAGLLFCFTLAVLLVASINYQLNLGYVLTFLLAGSGLVSMHMTHGTLRGLTLHLRPVHPVFAGDTATLEAVLSSAHRPRYGMGLRLRSGDTSTLGHTDVPGGGQSVLRIGFVPGRRGRQPLPTLCVETRFPLGLFRAWAVWHPAMSVLVYPRPERPASALPASRAVSGGPLLARSPAASNSRACGRTAAATRSKASPGSKPPRPWPAAAGWSAATTMRTASSSCGWTGKPVATSTLKRACRGWRPGSSRPTAATPPGA
jgi:hypothetical protein